MREYFKFVLIIFFLLILLLSYQYRNVSLENDPVAKGEVFNINRESDTAENHFENYTYFGQSFVSYGQFSEELVQSEIIENVSTLPADLVGTIKKNLNRTGRFWGQKKWYVGESACPFQIRVADSKLENRNPDGIGIGVGKSGTGSLAFLDCHPQIVFRAQEPTGYLNIKQGASQEVLLSGVYKTKNGGWALPRSAINEF